MRYRLQSSRFCAALLTGISTLILFGTICAQPGTATLTGVVKDQTGAFVPGVQVTITNPLTKFTRSTNSNYEGAYSFPGIQPAAYKLEFKADNFKKSVKVVQAQVDSTLVVNIILETGDLTAIVDIKPNSIESVINTQDASIGNTFVRDQITQLPTNLRRVNDLLTLQPGVTREGYVAGGRSDQANITLDGVDINDQQTGGRISQFQTFQDSVLRVTAESVEEFRITTTNANASQGRSSGAQISFVTRSGSNDWHGAGFYFVRPTNFSANDFFNNALGRYEAGDRDVLDGLATIGEERVPRPSLSRNIFGGRIGGPIISDKFFFFYSYEGQHQELGQTVTRTVPMAHMGDGEMRFPGTGPTCVNGMCTLNRSAFNSIFNQVLQNPLAVAVYADAASRYPVNDINHGDGINTGGFRYNSLRIIRENTHIAKLDYFIDDSQQLFFRANYQWDNSAGQAAFPDTPSPVLWSHPSGFVLGHDWVISSNKINNFRYGLTRQAFSQQGDSSDPSISFSEIFSPRLYQRPLSRVTPVTNITDDFIWIKRNHTVQFGGNVRIIRNQRSDFANAYDAASTNPDSYNSLGSTVIIDEITNAGYTIAAGQNQIVRNAATALIGRLSQYSGSFTFDIDGSVLPAGTADDRNFATEEYDAYGQDIWKPFQNLTITAGLRYSLSRPVYEKNGFQVLPDERLGHYFDRRVAGAAQGVPVNDPIQFQLGGPVNKAPGFYSMDWNNFQPRIAVAWSPSFRHGFWKTLFGEKGESTFRGGFTVTNDYFGSQLAVSFDNLSSIGFTSSLGIQNGTFNVTDRPAPLFTGFGQNIRSLPFLPIPLQRFMTPADETPRIETSLDATIVSPVHYTWNLSYGRALPGKMYAEVSYVGRAARNLLAARDIMALNNLVDPQSGMDWYMAAGMLIDANRNGVPIASLAAIPYFENLFPNAMAALALSGLPANNNTQAIYGLFSDDGFGIRDYTFIQRIIDDATAIGLPVNPGIYPNMFFHPQYAAFSAYSTAAYSDYHGGSFTLRQRLGGTLSYDFNYTFSKSMDNASGLQTGASYGSLFILNPLRPDDNYSLSDFDSRHVVNANFIFQPPIGKGKKWFSGLNTALDALVGGWQLAGVYRWNTGLPISAPYDGAAWATNWNILSKGVRLRPVDFGVVRSTHNAFTDPQAAFNSFRNARPGETGDRNAFRKPGFQTLDLGLTKNFKMPWNDNHKLQFRWEVFNVTNFQYFNAGNVNYQQTFGLPPDSETGVAPVNFGRIYNGIQGAPRSMQFGLRYEF